MKNALALICVISFYLQGITQVVFCPLEAKWNALFIPDIAGPNAQPGVRANFKAICERDTVIGSDTARILAHDWFFGNCDGSPRQTYLKQKGDTIYFRNWITKNWQILFNFGANPGSNWKIDSVGTLSYTVNVNSTSIDVLNSDSLRTLSLTYQVYQRHAWTDSLFSYQATATERLGGSRHLFNLEDGWGGNCDQEIYLHMLCYEDPGIGLIKLSTLPCDFSNLVGISKESRETVNIGPNPTHGKTKINFLIYEDWSVEVRDVMGRSIIKEPITSQEYMLDLTKETTGIYFLILKDKYNHFSVHKLIRD
jgi:hypothetical protein